MFCVANNRIRLGACFDNRPYKFIEINLTLFNLYKEIPDNDMRTCQQGYSRLFFIFYAT